jgi:hypothetical protein
VLIRRIPEMDIADEILKFRYADSALGSRKLGIPLDSGNIRSVGVHHERGPSVTKLSTFGFAKRLDPLFRI